MNWGVLAMQSAMQQAEVATKTVWEVVMTMDQPWLVVRGEQSKGGESQAIQWGNGHEKEKEKAKAKAKGKTRQLPGWTMGELAIKGSLWSWVAVGREAARAPRCVGPSCLDRAESETAVGPNFQVSFFAMNYGTMR